MKDPIKNFGNAKPFYEMLRDVNPHLPDPKLVTMDTITLTAGPNELAALNLTVFITLPDYEKMRAQEQADHPLRSTMDVPMPAGYKVEPAGTVTTRPMRIDT